jgi:hypothetical protein
MTAQTKNAIPHRVIMHENAGDKFQVVFDCHAADADDAETQAETAHPGYEIVSVLEFDHTATRN